MAIPVIPLMLVGVGVFVLGRRRRSGRAKDKEQAEPKVPFITPHKVVFVPPEDRPPKGSGGQPGQPCKAKNGRGAWDDMGLCKRFWIDGDTDDAIRRLAREEWEARGRPSFSNMCLAVDDGSGDELAAPKPNPIFTAIVATALQRYYDVGPLFPPTTATQFNQPTSPYWVHEAWAKAVAVVRQELCEL